MTPQAIVALMAAMMFTLRGGRGGVANAIEDSIKIMDDVLDRDLTHLSRMPEGYPNAGEDRLSLDDDGDEDETDDVNPEDL